MSIKWLTNTHESEVNKVVPRLIGNVVVGRPRETDVYSVVELERMKMVGLYRLENKEGDRVP